MSREEALMHFGIKGMKWGKRKPKMLTPDQAKAKQILKNPEVIGSDRRRLEYMTKSPTRKMISKVASITISEMVKTNQKPYSELTELERKHDRERIQRRINYEYKRDENLGKSTLDKYDNNGKRKDGSTPKQLSQEDALQITSDLAYRGLETVIASRNIKLVEAQKQRDANKAMVDAYLKEVMSAKMSTVSGK